LAATPDRSRKAKDAIDDAGDEAEGALDRDRSL
jgi:hypothetical protein